jgi:hypothetical protein
MCTARHTTFGQRRPTGRSRRRARVADGSGAEVAVAIGHATGDVQSPKAAVIRRIAPRGDLAGTLLLRARMKKLITGILPLLVAVGVSACVDGAAPASGRSVAALAGPRQFADVRAAVGPDGDTVYHAAACGAGHRFQCKARIRTDAEGHPVAAPFAGASGYAPADLQAAYGLDPTRKPNATIAVVDAFGYPNAESDLASYRKTYNLPPCTVASGCLKIVDQTGGTNLPGAPPSGDDWTVETALDLDMASAACPNCKLLLVQATDDMGDGLNIGQKTAAMLGATVVSDSWGDTTAGASAMMQEQYFNVAPYKTGIFIAAGDDGYDNYKATMGPDYPSTSEYVIAVGGTNLKKSTSSTRGWTETAWTSGGSSCSDALPVPAWQMGITTGCKFRAACDVAAVGDPATGVAVFNADTSASPFNVGGTSASSPFVAGVFALYGHGEVQGDWVYNNKTAWNDVTSGTNGTCGTISCQTGVGWDGPTGWGTPNGTALAMIAPGDGTAPPDMATPPDMTTLPDMTTPPDMADGTGTGGNGGSGGNGGGGNGGGNGNNGGGGCSLGGELAGGGLWMFLVVGAALLARGIRFRRD